MNLDVAHEAMRWRAARQAHEARLIDAATFRRATVRAARVMLRAQHWELYTLLIRELVQLAHLKDQP